MPKPSRRIGNVCLPPFNPRATGPVTRDRISLGQALTDIDPPAEILDRVRTALGEPSAHRYSADTGMPELRCLIGQRLARAGGRHVDPESEILVTAGGNQAFLATMLTILDPGHEVLLPSPYFPNHEMAIHIAGGVPVEVPLSRSSGGFTLDPEAVAERVTSMTRAIVLVSPNNPTGAVFSERSLRAVAALAEERDLFLVSDESYEHFLFDGHRHFSVGSLDALHDHVVTLTGFSKTYGITGWRVGFLAGPARVVRDIAKVHNAMMICAPVAAQILVVELLNSGVNPAQGHLPELAARRAVLREAVARDDRLVWHEPQGAFFGFVEFRIPVSSVELADALLVSADVHVLAGSAFGRLGEGHLRLSFGAVSRPRLSEACERILDHLSRR